ncbi:MAG: DoxX family protein [Bdellovibrionales bacterium]
MRAMTKLVTDLLTPKQTDLFTDLGLLIIRLSFGGLMAFAHGWGKFQKMVAGGEIKFADPIGLGMELSLYLAATTEFVLALLLAVGFATRLVTIPLAFTMYVAAFIVHGDDPFRKMEFALLYLVPFVALFFTGPGRISLDFIIFGKKK